MKVIWIFQAIKWLGLTDPGNIKIGGVCIYFSKSLLICLLDVPCDVDERLLRELSCKNKKCFIATYFILLT